MIYRQPPWQNRMIKENPFQVGELVQCVFWDESENYAGAPSLEIGRIYQVIGAGVTAMGPYDSAHVVGLKDMGNFGYGVGMFVPFVP